MYDETLEKILKAKEERRKKLALLPIEEKIKIVIEMQKIALNIRKDSNRMVWDDFSHSLHPAKFPVQNSFLMGKSIPDLFSLTSPLIIIIYLGIYTGRSMIKGVNFCQNERTSNAY